MNQRLAILLSIVLGILLIGIWIHITDFEEMLNIFRTVKIEFIFPLGIFFILTYFFRSLRWRLILSAVERITTAEAVYLSMINYFINFLIPVHAGEVTKSVLLKKMKGTPVSKSLPTIYMDKVADLLPVFLLFIVTPFVKTEASSIIYLASGVLLFILSTIFFSLFLIAYKKNVAFKCLEKIFIFFPEKIKMKLKRFFDLFLEGLTETIRLSSKLPGVIGLTILALLVHCAFMWLFFYSFGVNLPVLTVLVGYLLLNVSFILPAPPGFTGSLELTFSFIFTYLFGYGLNLVSAVAAYSHVFVAILFGFWGILSITFIGARLSSVLRMKNETEEGVE